MPVQTTSTISFSQSALPISKPLLDHLSTLLSQHSEVIGDHCITINFSDQSYSAENGGYHPVEIALTKTNDERYSIIYITDFSFCGQGYPELERDLDFDLGNSMAFARYTGWQSLPSSDMTELYQLWESNFLTYLETQAYDQILVQSH
jgi:hypothetical protein